jgi:transposase
LGRSRGGLTTKLHVACTDEHTAVAITLSEGHRHDSLSVPDLIEEAANAGTITRVTADRAYDGEPTRAPLREAHIEMVIPSPKNRRVAARYSRELYKLRHKVENHFRKLFDFRRIATRYEKLARSYLAFVHLVSSVVLLRGIR